MLWLQLYAVYQVDILCDNVDYKLTKYWGGGIDNT